MRWLIAKYPDNLANLIVFVPTARVAARVRGLLAAEMTGVLPAVLPLKGNGELADLLRFELGKVVQPVAARIEIAKLLKAHVGQDADDIERQDAMAGMVGARLWRRVDGLYHLLDRLALHGVKVRDLRGTVPGHLVGYWDLQATTLLAIAEQIERWLVRRGEMLPGEVERRALMQAAEILGREDCGWVPVVAGVVDGGVRNEELGVRSGASEILRVAAVRGDVVVPEFVDGVVTAGLVGSMGLQDYRVTGLAVGLGGAVTEMVAEMAWDEAWLAALAVRRAVEDGRRRVAVVSPSKILLERVSALMEQWGLKVPVAGMQCLDKTPVGRAVLAVESWGLGHGTPKHWLEAMKAGLPDYRVSGLPAEDYGLVMAALAPLAEVDAWFDLEDWRAVMGLVLGETAAPASMVSEGVVLLGPLEARLLDFEYVIAAGMIEGVWPAFSTDAWLSEAHLRALGMANMEHKALLAGTEFESVLASGGEVLVLRARTVDGKEMVRSRFLAGLPDNRITGLPEAGLPDILRTLRGEEGLGDGALGVFRPEGTLWPARWSASFTEALLACPYKALGERVLQLEPLDPLTPTPDARTAGLLAHRWLERIGKEGVRNQELGIRSDEASLVARLLEIAEMELRQETAVVRAVWRGKFAKLAPALVARWMEDRRSVVAVEKKLKQPVGRVTMTATLDRVEGANGGAVIIDFKTSTPPSWASVASGERPQLALEAWLLMQDGTAVEGLEYWQLRGYGPNPVSVMRAGAKYGVEDLMAPVAAGVAKLVEAYAEGADFPAVPDMAGGGLMATGHCARCALAGVCRRKAQGIPAEGVGA